VNSFIVIILTKVVHLCYSIDQQNTLFEGISKYSLVTSLSIFEKKSSPTNDNTSTWIATLSYILKQQWCLSVWAMPRRFFQSLLVPCGAGFL